MPVADSVNEETPAAVLVIGPGFLRATPENDDARGQPVRCPGEVVARGRWRDGGGKVRIVEACAEHAVELEESTT